MSACCLEDSRAERRSASEVTRKANADCPQTSGGVGWARHNRVIGYAWILVTDGDPPFQLVEASRLSKRADFSGI